MIDKNLILETDYGQLKDFEGNARAACIDTRILKPGEIFFALKGENSDGHNYISAAFEKGASLCTVNKDWYETNR
ncbi:MAG: UDP-N-acetylmuramoyl-tripeptide--D-alanyl-D-alanine ligase, partial [Candidatus Neomarinimicrobiota bacterium]